MLLPVYPSYKGNRMVSGDGEREYFKRYRNKEGEAVADAHGRSENTIMSREEELSPEEGGQEGEAEFTLVIPAYNEEKRIGLLLSELDCRQTAYIFICDGSDNTAAEIKQWGILHPEISVRCLEHPTRIGKGKAVCEGLSLAKTRFAGYMDADGSASYSEMVKLICELEGNDGVIGSRWVAGAKISRSQGLLRRFESRIFNRLIRLLFGLPFQDTQCGAKVFRKDALDTVLPGIVSPGFEFDVELLWRLMKKGYKISEYPIEWNNRGDSHVKGPDAISMMGGLIRLRFGRVGDDSRCD